MKKLLLSALMFASISSFAQTKKVILHDYTGVNCQYCTDGTVRIEAMQATNPTDFIPIQIHTGSYTPSTSPMKTSVGDEILTLVTPPGYPCGSVDMLKYDPSGSTGLAMSRSYWGNAFSAQKAKGAIASISIDNRVDKGGGTYECDVVVEFTSAPSSTSPINIQLFILEDNIKALKADNNLRQINYSGGPHSGASPLTWEDHQYKHNNVLRGSASGNTWGWTGVIPATPKTDGTKYTQKATFTLGAGWDKTNIRVVAFIAHNGSLAAQKEILNAEMMPLSSFWPQGVHNVEGDVEVLSAYPSPAQIGSVVNVVYNNQTSGNVAVNVYDMTGKLVATPHNDFDAAGGHTILWETGLDNVVPGNYVIEVATAAGRHTQAITLQ